VLDSTLLPRLLAEMCDEEIAAGQALLDLVCAPAAPIETLKAVRELARTLLAQANTSAHRNAATILYHAAIAAAYAGHAVNLSRTPARERSTSYAALAAALGDHSLAGVFHASVRRAAAEE
jgi:hypothetical protein